MKNVNLSYLFLLQPLIFLVFNSNCKVIKEIITIEIEEVFNSKTFIDKKKINNGTEIQEFFVDANPVIKDLYIKEKMEAKFNELQLMNKIKEEKSENERKFKKKSEFFILKKLIRINLKDLENYIEKLKENNLEKFYSFSPQTFNSLDNFQVLENEFIPEAKFTINQTNDELTVDLLHQMLDKIESYLDKINEFYKNTINNAIELCDDTKLLKDLLELI